MFSPDEGISLSTLSTRRMSATFERRMSSTLERRLSGGKSGHGVMASAHCSAAAHHRVSMALGQCDSCSESAWSEVYMDQENKDASVQTTISEMKEPEETEETESFEQVPRSLEECLAIMKQTNGTDQLVDSEIIQLVEEKKIKGPHLEKTLGDPSRGVRVRRKIYGKNGQLKRALEKLPYQHYDYEKVMGACCENVVGYMPVPVGVVGPLNLDGRHVQVSFESIILFLPENLGSNGNNRGVPCSKHKQRLQCAEGVRRDHFGHL